MASPNGFSRRPRLLRATGCSSSPAVPVAVALAVAPLVDPGEVIASDVAIEMADVAERRARSRGFSNVHGRRLDIEDIAEPDASFDIVFCRDGLQFALDPARAVTEIGRVVKPGGRVAVATWAARDRNPWLGLVFDVLGEQLGQPVPPPGIPGPFSLSDAAQLEALFVDAGFTEVSVEDLSVPMRAPSFDGWWRMTTSLAGPLALIIGNLDAETSEKLRTRATRPWPPSRPQTAHSTSPASASWSRAGVDHPVER